ncbi:hypothetical protein THAOC_05057 [Thalassiosira oceanica]|uniref:Uncharacterized protein n=1 Tax=Thalassiosira oceanica TaxID=159749 RepID=K0THX1_THAOC|nr:hypothetical protein THAOC_05057 [Thalassiosira oceanica]|eukprot:EJK73326.1 hypothetical protein THAOC_05057 [Thalassiosira oceanica]
MRRARGRGRKGFADAKERTTTHAAHTNAAEYTRRGRHATPCCWRVQHLLRILKSSARKMTAVTPFLAIGSGVSRITLSIHNLSPIAIPSNLNKCQWVEISTGKTARLLTRSRNFQCSGYLTPPSLVSQLAKFKGKGGKKVLKQLFDTEAGDVYTRTIVNYVPPGKTLLICLKVAPQNLACLGNLGIFSDEEKQRIVSNGLLVPITDNRFGGIPDCYQPLLRGNVKVLVAFFDENCFPEALLQDVTGNEGPNTVVYDGSAANNSTPNRSVTAVSATVVSAEGQDTSA